MKFRTPVELPKQELQLTPYSHIMTIGSCFANHIGQRLYESLPAGHVCVNPNGTLYNPVSIRNVLVSYLPESIVPHYNKQGFFEDTKEKQWKHWDYSTAFFASSQEALMQMLEQNWQKANEVFERLDVLFITFSTTHAYCLNEGEYAHCYVANCHKQPSSVFTENTFTCGDLFPWWESFLNELYDQMPHVKVVFTVSPYRYAKYGMHENALSKANLLLLIEKICSHCHNAIYFPAYEIVNDELRDYRFYSSDMLHPSEQAIDYIWERFTDWAFTAELRECAKERMAILKARNHKPSNPESESYRTFIKDLEEKEKNFESKWTQSKPLLKLIQDIKSQKNK